MGELICVCVVMKQKFSPTSKIDIQGVSKKYGDWKI